MSTAIPFRFALCAAGLAIAWGSGCGGQLALEESEWSSHGGSDEREGLGYHEERQCLWDGGAADGSRDVDVNLRWSDNEEDPGFDGVMVTPVTTHIDADGIPDIVFTAFRGLDYGGAGALVAVSGATGDTLWSRRSLGGFRPHGASGVAIAIHEGETTLVVAGARGLIAADRSGHFRWFAPAEVPENGTVYPSVGDLETDGEPEFLLGSTVFGYDGRLRWRGEAGHGGRHFGSLFADVSSAPGLEVVAGNTLYGSDGAVLWTAGGNDGWPAIVETSDGPLIVVVRQSGSMVAIDPESGNLLWEQDFSSPGGGPPAAADFNGDGETEIAVASGDKLRMFDSRGTLLWERPIHDPSSAATGCSAFDFDGDGRYEVVQGDEVELRVFDGSTGETRIDWSEHGSLTLYEYPAILDLNGDGHAELLLATTGINDGAASRGIAVLGNSNGCWAAAHRSWNQHAYSPRACASSSVPGTRAQCAP